MLTRVEITAQAACPLYYALIILAFAVNLVRIERIGKILGKQSFQKIFPGLAFSLISDYVAPMHLRNLTGKSIMKKLTVTNSL